MTNHVETHRSLISRNLETVENKLRYLADRVASERDRLQYVPATGHTYFTDIVAGVHQEILWTLANMHFDTYVSNAMEGDMEINRVLMQAHQNREQP